MLWTGRVARVSPCVLVVLFFSRRHDLARCYDGFLVFLSQKLTTVYRHPNVAIRIDWMRPLYSRYIVGRTRILDRRS